MFRNILTESDLMKIFKVEYDAVKNNDYTNSKIPVEIIEKITELINSKKLNELILKMQEEFSNFTGIF